MINVLFAKSGIENEEGMNHLWIQLTPAAQSVLNARIHVSLPSGIHRLRNLSQFDEEQTGEIVVPHPQIINDVIIEIFTREPISCGEKTLSVAFCCTNEDGTATRIEHFVPLHVVPEEEIDHIQINEAVVHKIKELQRQSECSGQQAFKEYTPTKIIRIDSGHISEWEKKYRIDGVV